MKAEFGQNRAHRLVGRSLLRSVTIVAVCLALVGTALPSFGLWLPWAKEGDKIAKRLNEIWAAVLLEDRKTLRMYVLGDSAQAFIDQEIAHAKNTKVKSYTSRVQKTTVDQVLGQFAWVEVERTATYADGNTRTERFLRVLKKVDQDWKLIVDVPKDRKQKEKAPGSTTSAVEKDFFDLANERLPGARSK